MKDNSVLPSELVTLSNSHPIVFFDGDCVLCSRFFHFLVKRDHRQRLLFSTVQSDVGQTVLAALGQTSDAPETMVTLRDGKAYQHAQAVAAALETLGGRWRAAALIGILPDRVTRGAYRLLAKRRYRIWGRRETCFVPSSDLESRFLAGFGHLRTEGKTHDANQL